MTDYYESPAYKQLLAGMADELDMPEAVVDTMYQKAVFCFNLYTIRQERGRSIKSLAKETGIELRKFSEWDEAGAILANHLEASEHTSMRRSFVALIQDGHHFWR